MISLVYCLPSLARTRTEISNRVLESNHENRSSRAVEHDTLVVIVGSENS